MILVAVFVPLFTLPLTQGWPAKPGLLSALQSLTIAIVPERREAIFEDGPITGRRTGGTSVGLQGSGVVLEFPVGMNGSEIRRAIRSYENGKLRLKDPTSGPRHFVHWFISQEAVTVRYAYIVSGSMLLLFAGIILRFYHGRAQPNRHSHQCRLT